MMMMFNVSVSMCTYFPAVQNSDIQTFRLTIIISCNDQLLVIGATVSPYIRIAVQHTQISIQRYYRLTYHHALQFFQRFADSFGIYITSRSSTFAVTAPTIPRGRSTVTSQCPNRLRKRRPGCRLYTTETHQFLVIPRFTSLRKQYWDYNPKNAFLVISSKSIFCSITSLMWQLEHN